MQGYRLPLNVKATTAAQEAIEGAQYALHAVPVQHSREFLSSIAVRPHSTSLHCPSALPTPVCMPVKQVADAPAGSLLLHLQDDS